MGKIILASLEFVYHHQKVIQRLMKQQSDIKLLDINLRKEGSWRPGQLSVVPGICLHPFSALFYFYKPVVLDHGPF